MSVDGIYEENPHFQNRQLLFYGILFLINAYNAPHMLQYTFVSSNTKFICPNDEICTSDDDDDLQQCRFLSENGGNSIISEWHLICQRSMLAPLSMSLFMIGVLLGAPVIGALSDSRGRKKILFLSLLFAILFNFLSALSSTLRLYILYRFMDGFVLGGLIVVSFVYLNEIVSPGIRCKMSIGFQGAFALGIIFSAFVSSQVLLWRHFTAVISLMGLPLIFLVTLLPESPHWLISKGRVKEAQESLTQLLGPSSSYSILALNQDPLKSSGDSLLSLLSRHPWCLLSLSWSWFANSALYYGLTLSSGVSVENLHVSTALNASFELPGYLLSILILSHLGRRRALIFFHSTAGLCLLGCLGSETIKEILSLLSKSCISASFAILYIYSAEIFPTSLRNSALGLVSAAARLGGVASPFLATLGKFYPNLHYMLFAYLSISTGALIYFMTETQGSQLPETLDDMPIKKSKRKISIL